MRAAAANPDSSRLVGIRVGRTLMIGWGLAALLGALAGVLVAPRLFLDVNFMGGVLVYSFAAATLGGFDSPDRRGASAAGSSASPRRSPATYIGFIGSDLKILVPLAIIFVVLLVRPTGLFGSPEVARRMSDAGAHLAVAAPRGPRRAAGGRGRAAVLLRPLPRRRSSRWR